MDSINILWPLVTGSLVVPIIAWLKLKLVTADLPFLWFTIQGLLNIGALAGLHLIFKVPIDWPILLSLATGGMVVTNGGHSVFKTVKKVKLKMNGET